MLETVAAAAAATQHTHTHTPPHLFGGVFLEWTQQCELRLLGHVTKAFPEGLNGQLGILLQVVWVQVRVGALA